MFKKTISYSLIFVLIFSLFGFGIVYGDAQSELDKINAEKAALQKELNAGKAVENNLNKQIKNLESQIAKTNLEISQLGSSIAATESKISEALVQLDQTEKEIAQQQQDLSKRLRAMYINGNVSFIDVLLGSDSVVDLMTNMDRVGRIYDADKEMLATMETQYQMIAIQKEYLLGLQEDLKQNKNLEAQKKTELEGNKSVVADKKAEVASDNKALAEQVDALNAEANALVAEILKLQGKEAFVGGEFTWPAPGVSRVSSSFGYRTHPILKVKKLHTGMDIACPSNTSIVAVNAGTVIKCGWNNSYGYMVMVDHGGGIVTLYAHNNSILVKVGDVVYRGQTIAKSGSTGMSTGPHLHFEVRVNGQYVNPAGYVSYGK